MPPGRAGGAGPAGGTGHVTAWQSESPRPAPGPADRHAGGRPGTRTARDGQVIMAQWHPSDHAVMPGARTRDSEWPGIANASRDPVT